MKCTKCGYYIKIEKFELRVLKHPIEHTYYSCTMSCACTRYRGAMHKALDQSNLINMEE